MARVLINLVSEQLLPNYIAIREIRPDRVVALATAEYAAAVGKMETVSGVRHEKWNVDAYDFAGDLHRVNDLLGGIGAEADEVHLNFTGGTKIMAMAGVVAALSPAYRDRVRLVYVDSIHGALVTMGAGVDGRMSVDTRPLTTRVAFDTFIQLAGEELRAPSASAAEPDGGRRDRVNRILAEESAAKGVFAKTVQIQLQNARSTGGTSGSVEIPGGKSSASPGRLEWSGRDFFLALPNGATCTGRHPNPPAYLGGLWLEEYVAQACRESGLFDEVHENQVIKLRRPIRSRGQVLEDKNELDVVVVKGASAAIVECKAGRVNQDAVFKLAALRDHLLGSFGLAVLVCRFTPSGNTAHVVERARDNRVVVVAESELPRIARRIAEELG